MLQFSCVKNMIGVSKIIIFQRTFLTEKKKVKETQNSCFFFILSQNHSAIFLHPN